MAGRAFTKDIKDIVQHGTELFTKRLQLMSLWQNIADNFYVERSDFTVSRTIGEDFAAHLTTSYPLMVRRDLGNAFSSMLRPTEKEWFYNTIKDVKVPEDGRKWLEWSTTTQRKAMYDRASLFTRATSEGDHDYASFGQCVISVEIIIHPRTGPQYLYRCWHLRDVAWAENAYGVIDTIHRKWKPTARDLKKLFRGNVHEKVDRACEKEPFKEFECRHIIIPSEDWKSPDLEDKAIGARMEARKARFPYYSLYVDLDNEWVMEETPLAYPFYIIPRWQTVSGTQYAFSPATVAALPDGRLLQEQAYTLLNAGQKAVSPPMIAVQEAIRSDLQIYAEGITWVDAEYDERLGEVLRPLSQDTSGLPLGLEMIQDTRTMLAESFFLNKLNLPQTTKEMTAYEVGQRVQEYIRNALPLFGPMEMDYNGQICELTFDLGLRNGLFGPLDSIPRSIRGQNVQFRFESPLHDALEAQKAETFLRTRKIIDVAAMYSPLAPRMVDWNTALRDALHGGKTPADWLLTEEQMLAVEQSEKEKQAIQNLLGVIGQGAQVTKMVGEAGQAVNAADAPVQ